MAILDTKEIKKKLSQAAELVTTDSSDYESSIARWSKSAERKAELVIYPSTFTDVQAAVKWTVANKHDLAIRGGGHNSHAASSTDGGVVIDLKKNLHSVVVDEKNKTARVEGGATWGQLNTALAAHGLATTGGTNSEVGVGGLSLGGGYGWLQGQHGLACDNILGVKMVTFEGELVNVNKDENSDLFWAIRGAGGNFGVVVEFLFQVYEHSNEMLGGSMVFPVSKMKQVCDVGLKIQEGDGRAALAVIVAVSPADHKTVVCIASPFYDGPETEAREFFSDLTALKPIVDKTAMETYVKINMQTNALFENGQRYVMKATPVSLPISQEVCDKAVARFTKLVTNYPDTKTSGLVFVLHNQNKTMSVPVDATAVTMRFNNHPFGCIAAYNDPSIDEAVTAFAQDLDSIALSNKRDGNVKFLPNWTLRNEDVLEIYGSNYPRLQQIKAKWDPLNIFDKWQPITPAQI